MITWGLLTCAAVAASRLNQAATAYDHLAKARDMAERVGDGRNDYNTEFGPANVALHEVAVAVELGDAGHALRAGTAVDTSTLSAERRARLYVDLARAHTQRRQIDEAVAALLEAETLTPEQIRNTGSSASSPQTCCPCRIPPRLSCGDWPNGWGRRKPLSIEQVHTILIGPDQGFLTTS